MNNNIITLPKIDGIFDIQPMIKPALSTLEITLLSVLVILLMTFALYVLWFYFFSIKAIAKRKIKKLKVQYSEENINTHDAIYQLCQLLRLGLQLKHISENSLLAKENQKHSKKWLNFTKKISTLRYKNNNDSSEDIEPLFEESMFWLKKWR